MNFHIPFTEEKGEIQRSYSIKWHTGIKKRDRETSSVDPQARFLPSKKNSNSGKPHSASVRFVITVNLSTWLIYGFREKKSRKWASFGAGNAELAWSPLNGERPADGLGQTRPESLLKGRAGPTRWIWIQGMEPKIWRWTRWDSLLISMADNFHAY